MFEELSDGPSFGRNGPWMMRLWCSEWKAVDSVTSKLSTMLSTDFNHLRGLTNRTTQNSTAK